MKQKQTTVNINTKLEMVKMMRNKLVIREHYVRKAQNLLKIQKEKLKEAKKELKYWEAMKTE